MLNICSNIKREKSKDGLYFIHRSVLDNMTDFTKAKYVATGVVL